MAADERVPYDEFSMFHENAEEFGIPYEGPPKVRREAVEVRDGRHLSVLVWGDAEPELVFLHGGAQNAHTWDTVALALERPLIAIDLPGHGHSDGGHDGSLNVTENASDVAIVVEKLAPNAKAVIGMSLGGMTTVALAAHAPQLVRTMVLVDILPTVDPGGAAQIGAFVNGPESFPSFDEILARTIQYNPTRTESSLRRGILHNAVQREDGSWVWRYARFRAQERSDEQAQDAPGVSQFGPLWDAIENAPCPVVLARGMRSQSVVNDEGEAELRRRRPDARIEHFEEAGHSLQGDTPVELAALIDDAAP
jgi:pimeloyl-ACP methyl ester carboxylesterase